MVKSEILKSKSYISTFVYVGSGSKGEIRHGAGMVSVLPWVEERDMVTII